MYIQKMINWTYAYNMHVYVCIHIYIHMPVQYRTVPPVPSTGTRVRPRLHARIYAARMELNRPISASLPHRLHTIIYEAWMELNRPTSASLGIGGGKRNTHTIDNTCY